MTVPYTVGVDGNDTVLLVSAENTTITLNMNGESTRQLIRLLEATLIQPQDTDEDWVEDNFDGA